MTLRNSFIYSSVLLLGAIVGLGLSISTPKPLRILPLAATIGLSGLSAYFAQKGIRPAEIDAMDRAAELACLEAERENALQEIQETDDDDRELSKYERKLNIEAEAMRRTLPTQLELRKMREILYPQQQIVINAPGQPPVALQPSLNPLEPSTTPDGLFDWNSLKDADRHPILGLIAKMGGGKSLLAKYLGRHILGGDVTVFDIYGSQQDWAGCDVLSEFEDMVLRMSEDNEAIEQDIAAYRSGKRNFKPQLVVLEEGKATIGRLQKLKLSIDAIEHLKDAGKSVKPGQIVQEWRTNHESVTRKIKRRLCLVSTNMNSSVLGINGETRDEITLIFPGTQGIGKAMKDTSMLKLGARQNQAVRGRLLNQLKSIKYPALVYHDGDWFAASVPELDENGNPKVTVTPSTSTQTVELPEPLSDIQKLDRLLDL